MSGDRIAILIPAYNAEQWIGKVVRESVKVASKNLFDRVLVVDDGSDDRTGEIAKTEGAELVSHDRNRGKGAALRTGLRYLTRDGADAVVTLDADGQHLPSEAPLFVERWRETGAHLVIGSRRHLFSEMIPRRRMANIFSAKTISIASGLDLEDSQSGYRLYTREFVEMVPFRSDGFSAESEMLVIAGVRGLRVEQVRIDLGFTDGLGTSHYAAVPDTLRIAARVVMTTLWHRLLV